MKKQELTWEQKSQLIKETLPLSQFSEPDPQDPYAEYETRYLYLLSEQKLYKAKYYFVASGCAPAGSGGLCDFGEADWGELLAETKEKRVFPVMPTWDLLKTDAERYPKLQTPEIAELFAIYETNLRVGRQSCDA